MSLSRFLSRLGLGPLLAFAVVLFALAMGAEAQTETPAPSVGGVDLSTIGALLGAIGVALVGLWGVGRDLVNRMAARPAVDGWDRAKAVVDKLEPWAETLAKIADPKDETVAPTPSNPTGKPGGAS